MTEYWAVNLFLWSLVLIISSKGAFVAAFLPKYVRRGDPMRLAVWLVSSLFVGHTLHWLLWPDSNSFWKALYVVGVFTALYVGRLMFAYGRGGLVPEAYHPDDSEDEYE